MRRRSRARIGAVAALLLGILAVAGVGLHLRSTATPAVVTQAVDRAWTALGLECSDGRFVDSGEAGRDLRGSKRVYELRCDADNPTGFVALIGTYDEPASARRDIQIFADGPSYGPACASSRLAIVGFFTATAMKRLCADLDGTYVPKARSARG